nr:NADH dehydrogenase subunit 6 [Hylurgus micklitzi]
MIFIMNWLMASSFVFLSHPLSLGFILLTQTIMMSLMTNMLYYNSWFGYILFLAMVSGLLIMFIYMTSIASNEKFSMPNLFLLISTSLIIFILIFILLSSDKYFLNYIMNNILTLNMSSYTNYNNITLKKFYNQPYMNLIMLLMMYLLLTLIAIVKITKVKFGPLRQK